MIKKYFAITILIMISHIGLSQQLTPGKILDNITKSIVAVEVKPVPGGMNSCTGFAWQSPDLIVTSLHAMVPKADIFVKYNNDLRYTRKAKILKIYADADLVLLEVINEGKPSLPVVPILSGHVNKNSMEPYSLIFSMGYPSGGTAAISRKMSKGKVASAPPETLESFLPPAYVDILKKNKYPKVNIEIIYVDGSLVPGFSGAPCMDANGNLVGIGDGGLEKGASNVSWLIPARFLSNLDASREKDLPEIFATKLHFSGTIPLRKDEINTEADTNVAVDYSKPVTSKDFEFYFIKNRSLQEMYESSGNDLNLIRILTQFKDEFNINIDPRDLRFDIYEDMNQGVVIAVPEGEELYFHREDNHFQVDRQEGKDVNILFNGLTGDLSQFSIENELNKTYRWLEDTMQTYWNVKNFEIDEKFNIVDKMYDNPNISSDDNRSFANVLMTSDPMMDAEHGGFYRVYLYVTMLLAPEKSFLSVASYKISINKMDQAKLKGVNCYDSAILEDDCQYFQTFVKAFCAAHLTTFAY